MGICASCLGQDRQRSSQTIDETDRLLDEGTTQYGSSTGGGESAQLDEDEARREREALEQITIEATENMIDASQAHTADSGHHYAHAYHDRPRGADHDPGGGRRQGVVEEPEEAEEEAAWLRSVQDAGLGSITQVKGLGSGTLVMDIRQLRQEPRHASSKKAAKAVDQ